MYLYRLCITHHVAVTKPEAGYAGGTASTGHLALSTTHIAAAAAEDTISDVTNAALLLLRMRRLADLVALILLQLFRAQEKTLTVQNTLQVNESQ